MKLGSVTALRSLSRGCAFSALALFAWAGGAFAASPDVVISQVYGGGGNSGAPYKNDFVELYNRGSAAVSLTGWSVQYASATGTSWQVTPLGNFTLQPGQYFLVQEAAGTGGTVNLPTPDATGSIAMSATAGKVALVTNSTALTCLNVCAGTASVKDFIGFGSTANNFEGSGPAPAPSNTTAVLRAAAGATDSDNNAADFSAGAPNPRNSGSGGNGGVNGACGAANGNTYASAPSINLCATGTPTAVLGSGPWTWSCTGSNGGSTAACSANLATGGPFTIFHTNDVHARLTPHKWVVPAHGSTADLFEDVGGAAHLAGKMLALVGAKPDALVLDGGDISEGNPVGDMNVSCSQGVGGAWSCALAPGQSAGTGYGNGGMTAFYEILNSKLRAVSGRGGRGIDALVVGNHDVRDASYIANMEHMAATGVPVLSANVRDLACTPTHPRYPNCEHFPPTTTVTVNGVKVGIIGYTTSSAQVGASLAGTLQVVDCQWTGSATCNIAPYVNQLRNVQGVQVVILLTHDGHSDLVDYATPVLADTADAKVPEVAITGHWHTWSDTVWQPDALNYKTVFAESSSYMKYIGEVNLDAAGALVSASQHVLRNADITPDPDVAGVVSSLKTIYQGATGLSVDTVVGYTDSDLQLDNRLKWWSADEYPWSGNNTAGQWITDAMKWKCDQIWSASGGCDLAIEAGGGVRSDIPKGAVTLLHVYETFPWADDTYVRVTLTGQQIVDFLLATNLDTGFSGALDVTAFDGIPTAVKMNGAPICLACNYKVAINNYMQAHPPAGYSWPATFNPEADPAATLVRDSLFEFMQVAHPSPASAYTIGGDRYHFNGEFSGGYRAVVTMVDDNEFFQGKRRRSFDKAFVRLLSATPETLARRGSKQVPSALVASDGSVVATNRLAEIELFRSFLGFKTGALKAGDIIEVWGKAGFFGGNPEFVDQEGVWGNGVEFKILGNDTGLAKPAYVSTINGLIDDDHKNHYVRFLAQRVAVDTVVDQYGTLLKVWDKTGFTAASLPGVNGNVLEITGVPTMENYGYRFRSDSAVVSQAVLPANPTVVSHANALPAGSSGPVTLSATAAVNSVVYTLTPVADAQVASGSPGTNYGSSSNIFLQGSSAAGTFGVERGWLRFDLSPVLAGSTIASATLQLWNWKSTGADMATEVRGAGGSANDGWSESALNWNSQPAVPGGAALDTKTLVGGSSNLWYGWNVTPFVQAEFAGDKVATLLVKPVDETNASSFGFDAKEFGSNAPVLVVATQSAAASVASLQYFYRYSTDNTNWGAWTTLGAPQTVAPYNAGFAFPNGYGHYEFYTVATDNLGATEPAPAKAQAAVHYQPASGNAQSISFDAPAPVTVGTPVGLAASASSGLAVSFSSQTPPVCTVAGGLVSTQAVGTCTISADQAGSPGYVLPAPTVSRSFAVQGLAQSISFAPVADHALGSGSFVLSASADSGLPVSFGSLTPAVCSTTGANGATVNLLALGLCTIAADQGGDATHAAAPTVARSFAITSGSAGGGDVPLPPWAGLLLAAGMAASLRARRQRTQGREGPMGH